MIKGASKVERIFLAVFPTDHDLERFIVVGNSGDLLFMHHPILMECGDPKGKWGKGFVPIKEKYIKQMKEKILSVYTCHAPLDLHRHLSTNMAIANKLRAKLIETHNEVVIYCTIEKTNTNELVSTLKEIFDIPYVDFEGQNLSNIQKIAIVAGCGDVVEWMKEAEDHGFQAYITGEIHCHIDNDYGKQK
ncbi:NIF3-related protein [Neobacillus massiliamazoniensis]|uniref:GTP cyclohydrolase 1 type 2 homolog n=1 Tax=Neobacillus massiliamazoniensis TaxID=1499688 RepID=A0A0U1NS47_9BACI|nr:NIF3-related protein [Neobacillus massiliamazoniensis]